MNLRIPPKKRGWKKLWAEFGVLATSREQRAALFSRDGGKCCKCGEVKTFWHAEHPTPLWLIDIAKWPACLWAWSIHNLTTICVECHKPKTAQEAKKRAKIKRIKARPVLKKIFPHPGMIDGHQARNSL